MVILGWTNWWSWSSKYILDGNGPTIGQVVVEHLVILQYQDRMVLAESEVEEQLVEQVQALMEQEVVVQ
jgi:Ni,Fe-hydrogenase I small subunit